MNRVRVLDCTLRDGGYCNKWAFGFENAKKIISALDDANIEIVECGFLTNRVRYDKNTTKFTTVEQISTVIKKTGNKDRLYVAMINYGEYDAKDLPQCDGSSITGIRVAFHKKDIAGAIDFCRAIKEKGYKIFVQAMVSLCYSDDEFLDLIDKVNAVKPYAFYIVDSFGEMKSKDLTRLFGIVERNLDDGIFIGYHSHNNLQLAYSNAQKLVGIKTDRSLIIDSSVYGMGRGAGNLNTELFVQFLNENYAGEYEIKPLLTIIDEILNDFYQRNYWGYSLPNYLSAIHHAHPNYASFLDDKKTLTVDAINEIFDLMSDEKKVAFDKNYIEQLYLQYMDIDRVQENRKADFKTIVNGKKILLIAPGKSSIKESKKIKTFSRQKDVLKISVNFNYKEIVTDFIFVSNLRRYRDILPEDRKKCIVTSNIPAQDVYIQTKYQELLNTVETVKDNAGLMAIRFLIDCGAKEIYLAGFDGYSHDVSENYMNDVVAIISRNELLDAMNCGMQIVLNDYCKEIPIRVITKPRHINVG